MPPPENLQRQPPAAATDWSQRVQDALGALPPPFSLPGFDSGSLLPSPEVFDGPIRSLDQTAATFEVMGGNLDEVLAGVRWQCNDATRFREHFTGTRQRQLLSRARNLHDLADELRRIKGRTADEIEWIRAIQRQVHDFLSRVEAAYQAARVAAAEALADAQQVQRSAASAVRNAAGSAADVVRAGLDEVTGGDGSDELDRAAGRAQAAVGDAQRALDAVVDFTTHWTFNGSNLPQGVCRAWYEVDSFMAQKAQTPEAYGVTYLARGPYQL